jgi:hypothetical protein
MISTRLVAAIAAGVLVVGILVGAAGGVLFGRASGPGYGGWGSGYGGMMDGGYGYHGMMGSGSWSDDDMLNEMREHMGWSQASPRASDGAAR